MDTYRIKRTLISAALAIVGAVALFAAAGGITTTRADGVALNVGDVLAGVGNGQIKHFDSAGTLLDTLNTTTGSIEDTGMCFDSATNLYATNFTASSMSKFDSGGNLLGGFGGGFNAHPESCVFDASGNIYVGQADGTGDVLKFDSAGNPLDSFDVATTNRGSDWIDLAADQCTLQYTSEGSTVKRYDVCTDTQLADFAVGLPSPCFANRILNDGGAIVACSSAIQRLDSFGAVVDTYDAAGEDTWFAMNLDPDGTSFWSANYSSGHIYQFDIATGAVLFDFAGAPTTTLAGLAVVGELTQGGGGCPDGPISPATVEGILFPGESMEVEKCVEVPVIPPRPDIFFLFDTTGSMNDDIATAQAKIGEIITAVNSATTDAQFGVGTYEDFPFNPWGATAADFLGPDSAYTRELAITGDATDITNAITGLTLGNGVDTPESGYEGLYQALTGAGRDLPNPDGSAPDGDTLDTGEIAPGLDAGFRTDSSKVIMLIGDASFHDPGDGPTGTQFAAGYPGASAADVTGALGDVTLFCLIPTELGDVGPAPQCGGLGGTSFDVGDSSESIVSAILTALGEVEVEVTMESTCTFPITTTFDPTSQTVESGSTVTFTETITVDPAAPGGTYECRDVVRIDGELLTDDAGQVVSEVKTIRVPEGFLTGGGQIITTKGKNGLKISSSGNVGFLADFSLVGHWNVVFHNVGVDAFDGGHFSSTAITFLQFHDDGGAGPNPPPANANVGAFAATGKFNGEDGWSIQVCLADRGEPGKNDSLRVRLFDPAAVLVYDSAGGDFASEDNTIGGFCADRHKLDNGNYQIHSGLKQ